MAGVIFYLLVIAAMGGVAALAVIARRRRLDMVGLALHPFNVLGFLLFIVIVDFVNLFEETSAGKLVFIARAAISRPADVTYGFVFFLLCEAALIAGIATASFTDVRTSPKTEPASVAQAMMFDLRAARVCMAIALLAGLYAAWSIILVSLEHHSFFYVAGARTVFFRQNGLLLVIVAMMAPAYILYGSREQLKNAALVLPLIIAFLYPVGGRGKLLYAVIALAYWFCRRYRVSPLWLYASAPVVGFAAVVYGFYGRQRYFFPTMQQYLHSTGGYFGALFDQPSISMAEAITLNINHPILSRAPWDSIVGALMLPLPREIFPWKPLGASTAFTMQVDLQRWLLVRSEWTITGFANLFYDFGYVGAIGASFGFAYLWARIICKSQSSAIGTAFAGPVAILVAYQFIRGDINIVSQFLWPVFAVAGLHWLGKRLLILHRKNPARPRLVKTQSNVFRKI